MLYYDTGIKQPHTILYYPETHIPIADVCCRTGFGAYIYIYIYIYIHIYIHTYIYTLHLSKMRAPPLSG